MDHDDDDEKDQPSVTLVVVLGVVEVAGALAVTVVGLSVTVGNVLGNSSAAKHQSVFETMNYHKNKTTKSTF